MQYKCSFGTNIIILKAVVCWTGLSYTIFMVGHPSQHFFGMTCMWRKLTELELNYLILFTECICWILYHEVLNMVLRKNSVKDCSVIHRTILDFPQILTLTLPYLLPLYQIAFHTRSFKVLWNTLICSFSTVVKMNIIFFSNFSCEGNSLFSSFQVYFPYTFLLQ